VVADDALSVSPPTSETEGGRKTSIGSAELDAEATAAISDGEDETGIRSPGLSRSNSVISLSSKGLTNEEGRTLRVGHRFRAGYLKQYSLLAGVEEIGADPNHVRVLHELLDELHDDALKKEVEEQGVVEVFMRHKTEIMEKLRASDPDHWAKFIESQEMAKMNVSVGDATGPKDEKKADDEVAITD